MKRLFRNVGLAAAALLAARVAHAQDDELVGRIRQALEANQAKFIAEGFESGMAQQVLEKAPPKDFQVLCRTVTEHAADLVMNDAVAARTIAEGLLGIATTRLEAAPSDATALSTAAWARRGRGRVAVASKATPEADEWKEAAALLEKAWAAQPAEASHAVDLIETLAESARVPGADAAAASAAASAAADRAIAKHPQDPGVLGAFGGLALGKARAAAAAGAKKPELVALVQGALTKLQPAVAKDEPPIEAATTWNELVTFQSEQKLGLKAELKTAKKRVGFELWFEVPVSKRWLVDENESTIQQRDADGRTVRWFRFDSYQWDTAYQRGGMEAGGDNLKGLATGEFIDAKTSVNALKSSKEPSKTRLNGRIAGCFLFEVVGTPKNSTSVLRNRAWFWKSEKGQMKTFALWVTEDEGLETDLQAKSVLDSVTEQDKKK